MRCIDASLSPLVGGAAQAAPTHVIFPYISYSPRSSQFYSLRSCYLFRRSTPRAVLVPRGLAPLCGAHAVAAALYSRRFRSSTVDRFRAGFRSTLSAPFSPYRGPSFLAAIDLTRNLVAAAAASRQQPRPCRLRRCDISFKGNGALPACSAAVLSPTHPHRARGNGILSPVVSPAPLERPSTGYLSVFCPCLRAINLRARHPLSTLGHYFSDTSSARESRA